MRGCLVVLGLAALFVFGAAWFAGPPVAAALIETSLTAGGVQSSDIEVSVDSEPNWEVVTGRADRVRIRATTVRFRDVEIERMDIDLHDASIIDRSANRIEGQLEGIVLRDGGPADGLRIRIIRLGGGPEIEATTEIASDEVAELVSRTIEARTGQEPDEVVLAAPDRMRIVLGSATIEGRLEIDDDGALVLVTEGPAGELIGDLVLVQGGALPVELREVAVSEDALVLEGRMAPGLLG